MMRIIVALVALTLAFVPTLSFAHGVLVNTETKGGRIEGSVRYSDGTVGVGDYVELKPSLDAPVPIAATVTDANGRFSFRLPDDDGVIVVHGDEGHTTLIAVRSGEHKSADVVQRSGEAPRSAVWILVGGLLLLVSIVAAILLKRSKQSA